jgi:hypothetical protein
VKIPLHWVAIGLVALITICWGAGFYEGRQYTLKAWRAEVAQADAAALKAKADLDEKTRAKEAADAEHAMNLEAQHAKDLEAVRAGSAGFIDTLTRRLRVAEARCTGGVLSSTAADPGVPERGTGQPESGHRGPDLASANRLREVGLTLQSELRNCRAWVLKHGR